MARKVFFSSTFRELAKHREALTAAIEGSYDSQCVCMDLARRVIQAFHFAVIVLYLAALPAAYATDYEHVNLHVANVPEPVTRNSFALAKYLVEPFESENERAWAIYRWITTNVDYDTEALLQHKKSYETADEILKHRRCVCIGYANLFKHMAAVANLEAEVVIGYSKAYGYERTEIFTENNRHAWNAVKTNGEWKLVDATWGSGFLSDEKSFVRSFNDYFFMTPPEQLIQTHFPDFSNWQLLNDKVSKVEFAESVYLRPKYFEYGLRLLGNKVGFIFTDSLTQIRLFAPRHVDILARLFFREVKLDRRYTFTQRDSDIVEVNAIFPYVQDYALRVFANKGATTEMYDWVIEYMVKSAPKENGLAGFPDQYLAFREHKVYLYEPRNKFLRQNQNYYFRIKAEDAEEAGLVINEQLILLKKEGVQFHGHANVTGGIVLLVARFPGDKRYHHLLKYESILQ